MEQTYLTFVDDCVSYAPPNYSQAPPISLPSNIAKRVISFITGRKGEFLHVSRKATGDSIFGYAIVALPKGISDAPQIRPDMSDQPRDADDDQILVKPQKLVMSSRALRHETTSMFIAISDEFGGHVFRRNDRDALPFLDIYVHPENRWINHIRIPRKFDGTAHMVFYYSLHQVVYLVHSTPDFNTCLSTIDATFSESYNASVEDHVDESYPITRRLTTKYAFNHRNCRINYHNLMGVVQSDDSLFLIHRIHIFHFDLISNCVTNKWNHGSMFLSAHRVAFSTFWKEERVILFGKQAGDELTLEVFDLDERRKLSRMEKMKNDFLDDEEEKKVVESSDEDDEDDVASLRWSGRELIEKKWRESERKDCIGLHYWDGALVLVAPSETGIETWVCRDNEWQCVGHARVYVQSGDSLLFV